LHRQLIVKRIGGLPAETLTKVLAQLRRQF
jgi:hypothetical protein